MAPPDPTRRGPRPAGRWRGDDLANVRPATADRVVARRGQRRHPGGLPPAVPGLSFLGKPLALVLLSHLIAALLRRRRTPVALAAVVSAVGWCWWGAGCSTPPPLAWAFPVQRRSTPSPRICAPPSTSSRTSRPRPRHCRASSPAPRSRQWITAFLADWAAFRLWAPFEAVLPNGPVRVRLAVRRRPVPGWCGGAVPAVLVFLLLHRAWRLESSAAWIRGDAQRQPGAGAGRRRRPGGRAGTGRRHRPAPTGRARRSHHGLEGPRRQ